MKYLMIALLVIFPSAALAAEIPLELIEAMTLLLGDKAASIIAILSVLGYGWTLIRQLISASTIAKLPIWLIWALEAAAGNKGKAENSLYNDPRHRKRIKISVSKQERFDIKR